MTFVQQKIGLFSVHHQTVFGFFDDAFCVGNAARHSVQNLKMAVRIFCDYVCERGFSRAGRTVEDATSQSVRGNRPS